MLSRVSAGLGCLLLFTLLPLFGQSDLATVTGVVIDSGQAVMPAVSVTIRNTDTNEPRTILTNPEGAYTLTGLPPGPYELVVEKAGFRSYSQTGIILQVGQTMRADVKMEVGSVTETVKVTADVITLNTENGSIKGEVIVSAEIQDMPLNGRDFTELALLVPGVTPKADGGQGSFGAINGARPDNTGFRVDGFDDRNIRGAAAQLRPNIDAMQEFKMETSGYSAEYGKMAGGIMQMVLRSGTNQFHGSVFEYLRNNHFDSKSYFDTDKLGYHQNQFGGVVSGPMKIPKVYNGHDRTFFMISWESYRLRWGETNLGNVATALERVGNFTQTKDNSGKPIIVKNPFANNAAFPGNIIPASMFSAVGVKVLSYYPLPNRTQLGNNYLASANNINDWDSTIGKVDHRFSEKDTMAIRYGKRWGRNNAPWAGSNLGIFQNDVLDDRSLGGIDYTHMFRPSLISEFRFGFSRNSSREHIISDGGDTASQLGMAGSTKDPLLQGFPLVNVTNYLSIGYAANEPVQYFVTDWQWDAKMTWIKANHILKFGVDYNRYQFNQPYFNNSRGSMTANGIWTGAGTAANGNSIGDLLLGLLNTSSITTQTARNYMRQSGIGTFINDDWKITRKLTLNLGVRYEIDTPPYDKYDRMTNFILPLNKVIVASSKNISNYDQLVANAGLGNQIGLAKDAGLPRSLVYPFYKAVAPRVGFAWHPIGSTVLRGGYGIFFSGQLLNDVRNGLDNTFPVVLAYNFTRSTTDPNALSLNTPWNLTRGTQTGTATSTGWKYDAPQPYLQAWNMTVERELPKGMVIEVGYVGSKGTHLSRQYNVNQPVRTEDFFLKYGTGFPVPYPPFGTINYWDFGSNSIYNAGQITLRKQSRGGLFYRLSYQYAKSIDTNSQSSGQSTDGFAGALDPMNLRLDRARSDWDRGHVFTATFSYQLPVGRGKKLLGGMGRIGNSFLGGWQLAGTATYYTGPPITIEDSTINANLGESLRPNRLANGAETSGDGRRGIDYPWFDPAAFVHTAGCVNSTPRVCAPDQYGFIPYVPGNAGRNILDGPGTQNINLSMLKRFTVGERKFIQARWEVFNIFNHPNFLLPNRNYNETAAGILGDVAASGQGGPRIMQFALRFEF
jgi:hypothetical protein